jgi:predicted RNase H-like HicB family nuclease
MTIRALVHDAEEGGYWAEVPSLPGCFTEGDTWDEVIENLKEVIQLYLSVETADVTTDDNPTVVEIAV